MWQVVELRGRGVFEKQQNVYWPQAGIGKVKVYCPMRGKDRRTLRGLGDRDRWTVGLRL